MRFNTVELSQLGPFAANQSIIFEHELTLIEGGNGCGKTTIAEALRREFHANYRLDSVDLQLAECLVFIGAGIGSYPGLGRFIDCLLANVRSDELTALAGSITKKLSAFVSDKRPSVLGNRYIVELSFADGLRIVDENRADYGWRFAASENFALALAINLAAREMLKLEVPIVADAPFEMVGQPQFSLCFEAILSMSVQRIVLCQEYVMRRMGVLPDYRLQPESPDNGLVHVIRAKSRATANLLDVGSNH